MDVTGDVYVDVNEDEDVIDCSPRSVIRAVILIFVLWVGVPVRAADETKPPAIGEQQYRVFRGDGTPATLDDVLADARMADVTFLGETHDDPVAHYLEAEILKRLASAGDHAKGGEPAKWILSLEMFERDVQLALDEYLGGLVSEREFLDSTRPWKTYKTDYRALIEFAKDNKIPVVAANAPSRYVNRVSRMGKASLEQLSKPARTFLPPLPYAEASKEYQDEFQRVMEEAERESQEESRVPAPKDAKAGARENEDQTKIESTEPKQTENTHADTKKGEPSHRLSNPRFALEAQSLWDSTMAYSIAQALKIHPNARALQVNGEFHSRYRRGILEHLDRYRPRTKSIVVTMIPDKAFPAWNEKKMRNTGDFVVVTDGSLQRSAKAAADPKTPENKPAPNDGGKQ